MFKSGTIDPNIDMNEIVRGTKNFTGSDIEQLVKLALSFAIAKVNDFLDFSKPIDPNLLPQVNIDDFRKAVLESKPLFGVDETFEIYK
jgi:vesicle-fusing ATPase